ncbi:MAG: RNA polymerase sigma factor, partial [Pseudomonadota bacterium]
MDSIEKKYCADVRKSRHAFLQTIDPYRNDLFKYCRSLTKQPWDAEDLVQETIAKAYSKLGEVWLDGIKNPKSYLFRIATNTWFDQCRRSGVVLSNNERVDEEADSENYDSLEIRDALETLLTHLPPKERVAVLLKDIFDYPLEDISVIMETTTGAVKSALFRGRSKMNEIKETSPSKVTQLYNNPSEQLMDSLVKTFNSRDMDGMISLFLEHASAEVYGTVQEWNKDEIRRGSMGHTIFDGNGQPLPEGYPMAKVVDVFGERLVIIIEKGDVLDDVMRIRESGGMISGFTSYYFCPEVLQEVAAALNLKANNHEYYLYM